jgi:hypothetical protein
VIWAYRRCQTYCWACIGEQVERVLTTAATGRCDHLGVRVALDLFVRRARVNLEADLELRSWKPACCLLEPRQHGGQV